MSLLIYSGLLYLLGISIVLALKPELMFSTDGSWKEFGLGRSKKKYTWMPFWLFAIMWAILSYLIILVIASATGLGGVSNNADLTVKQNVIEPENVSQKSLSTPYPKKKPNSLHDMKKGYYILDENQTQIKGVPTYMYLGPNSPNIVHHESPVEGEER